MLPPPQPASTTSRTIKLPPVSQIPMRRFLERRKAIPIPPTKSEDIGRATAYAVMRSPFRGTANATRLVGAVMVSVALLGLAPSVTDDGETPQAARGIGPVTVQVKLTCPEKPFCPVNVKTSVICFPVWVVSVVEAGAKLKSGAWLNVAVTV